MKFDKVDIVITDDDGYLVLKGLLPEGSILWSRNVEGKIAVKLKDNIDLDYILKNINSLHRTLRI